MLTWHPATLSSQLLLSLSSTSFLLALSFSISKVNRDKSSSNWDKRSSGRDRAAEDSWEGWGWDVDREWKDESMR